MASLLQSPTGPLSIVDVEPISQQLADELRRLIPKTEGFSVDEYLSLDGNYIAEYVDGCLQILPIPDALHQSLVGILTRLLMDYSHAEPNARTMFLPFRIRLCQTRFREPDVCYMKGKNASQRDRKFWLGADLVMEVVDEINPGHDFETKFREYAISGISEYWIVDPTEKVVHVFTLSTNGYVSAGVFGVGRVAVSPSLDGFAVDVADLFAQAESEA